MILVSYCGAILVFTGLYFSMSLIGDKDFSDAHYFYYNAYASSFPKQVAAHEIEVLPFQGGQRAFVAH